jgi:hypothetical protein
MGAAGVKGFRGLAFTDMARAALSVRLQGSIKIWGSWIGDVGFNLACKFYYLQLGGGGDL